MLVFPPWRPELQDSACRVPRWMPAERFAPYLARPVPTPAVPPPQQQYEDSDSSTSQPSEEEGACGWRGCSVRLPSVARLSAHVARSHALPHADGLFYCAWRGCSRPHKGFNARYKMLVHVRTHTNERPHTCNQCDKSFSRAENLKIHLRSHSGEKPYVCPYEGCGKAYSNSSDRFKHTRTHTVDKPYCCKVPGCNKRYTDPSSLRKHVKTYKHFAEDPKKDSSDEAYFQRRKSESFYSNIESTSPSRYPQPQLSPTIPPYNPVLPIRDIREPVSTAYTPIIDRVTYFRPLEPYHVRVPPNEMSYVEYTQMYEHAYRNYYSNRMYPVLTPRIDEKSYKYEESRIEETMEIIEDIEPKQIYEEEMPLNLICCKRLECKPIEELVTRTDLPLDLSTKS